MVAFLVIILMNAAILGAFLAIGASLPPLPRWPQPARKEYECGLCRLGYDDARAWRWHLAGQHPERFEDEARLSDDRPTDPRARASS